MHGSSASHGFDDDDGPLVKRQPMRDDAKFDITAMIDLVFMLNIYFLVTTVSAAMAELDLPVVQHCVATDADQALVVSIVKRGDLAAEVYLGESGEGQPLPAGEEGTRLIREALEAAARQQKRILLVKAEKNIPLRDVRRVGSVAGAVPGVELRMAVIERD